MVAVKKLEVPMKDLADTWHKLVGEGYRKAYVLLPEPNPDMAWSSQKAEVRAWRIHKHEFVDRRPSTS